MLSSNFFETGLLHKFRRGNSFFHQYSHLSLINRRYAFDNLYLPPIFDEDVTQNQYYLSYLKHGQDHWDYVLALHYLNTNAVGINPNGAGRGQRLANNYLYNETGHSYVASAGIGKQIGNFYTNFSFSFKDISDEKQFQTGIAAKWYPFSNRYMSLRIQTDYWQETDTAENPDRALVLSPSIGGYIGNSVYWEAAYSYGKSRNFTRQYGYIVNNHPDPVLSEYEALLRFNTKNEKLFLFVKYGHVIAENSYMLNAEKHTINYINQSITGGISWYF
jgi:hypothetical protein